MIEVSAVYFNPPPASGFTGVATGHWIGGQFVQRRADRYVYPRTDGHRPAAFQSRLSARGCTDAPLQR